MSVTVCCFLVFHTAVRLGTLIVGLAAAALGVLIAAISVFAPARRRLRAGRPSPSWPLLVAVTVAAVALSGLGIAAALLSLVN